MKLAILVAVVACWSCAAGLVFEVPANEEHCYFQDAQEGETLMSTFLVSKGGFLDIDIKIRDPSGKLIYHGDRETEGKYRFTAMQSGPFSYCFSNSMSTVTGKVVSLRVDMETDEEGGGEVAKREHLVQIEDYLRYLDQKLIGIQDGQAQQRVRERVHRDTSESTNERVQWWSLLISIVLVITVLWQLWYLRRMFDIKR